MPTRRIDHLTEAQKTCLRLVLKHHSSKEIAVILGVSPSAIDKRIERAIQILRVGSRFEAARALQRHEESAGIAAAPLPIASALDGDPRDGDEPAASREATGSTAPAPGIELSVQDVPIQPLPTYERLPSEPFDLPRTDANRSGMDQIEPWGLVRRFMGTMPMSGPGGTARNRLSKGDRLIRLIGIMALLAVTTVALLTMTTTVTSLFRQFRGDAGSRKLVERSAFWGGEAGMLKQRRQATDTVTRDFLRAEAAVDEAALLASTCVATLLQQRVAANLPVATGSAALQLVSDAASDIIKARQRFVDAHRALVGVRTEIGLAAYYGYGDEGECPPNDGALRSGVEAFPPVRIVAAA